MFFARATEEGQRVVFVHGCKRKRAASREIERESEGREDGLRYLLGKDKRCQGFIMPIESEALHGQRGHYVRHCGICQAVCLRL